MVGGDPPSARATTLHTDPTHPHQDVKGGALQQLESDDIVQTEGSQLSLHPKRLTAEEAMGPMAQACTLAGLLLASSPGDRREPSWTARATEDMEDTAARAMEGLSRPC